jgi:hypothetical protein
MNTATLRAMLPPPGTSVKKIRDTYYLYRQVWMEGKLTCNCLGLATPEQIKLYTDKSRTKILRWILKNDAMFVEALKLLNELRDFPPMRKNDSPQ